MDIEQLTKSQIVLLTLLVSFVTSIATGIVTVSLMAQAPPTMTQTINRVVERTVERVVPAESQTATVITKERTVVVKESELIAQAITRVSPSVVALHAMPATDEDESGTFIARGVVAAPGVVVTINALEKDAYMLRMNDGTILEATRMEREGAGASPLALFSFKEREDAPVDAAAFATESPKLGQSIVALTGKEAVNVANGIVTAFVSASSSASEDTETSEDQELQGSNTEKLREFETDVAATLLASGSVVINTDGAIVGIARGDTSRIISSKTVLDILAALPDVQATEQPQTAGNEGA